MSCRMGLACLALLLASSPISVVGLEPEPGSVFIRVADIGAGLCCVIKTSSDEYAVYDTGHWAGGGWRSFHCVDQVVPDDAPIAFMVLSHSDSDHLAATDEILANYHVSEVIRSGLVRDTTTWSTADIAIREAVETRGTVDINLAEVEFPRGTFAFGETSVTFLGGWHQPPPEWGVHAGGEFRNAGSICIRVAFAGRSILLCGDAVGRHIGDPDDVCIATEKFLCDHAHELEIQSDVLIAPHHGADNGSSTRFIQTVDPDWVIFSAGHDHEHPTTATAQRYLDQGVPLEQILRTDLGDDEPGMFEWKHGHVPGNTDQLGDDDIDILIRPNGELLVSYRFPSLPGPVPFAFGPLALAPDVPVIEAIRASQPWNIGVPDDVLAEEALSPEELEALDRPVRIAPPPPRIECVPCPPRCVRYTYKYRKARRWRARRRCR